MAVSNPAVAKSPADNRQGVKQARSKPLHERRALVLGLRVLVVAVVLVAWQLMSGPVLPSFAVSRPTGIATSFGDFISSSAGWSDIRTTAFEIFVGFLFGVLIGTFFGVALGASRLAGKVLEPLVSAVNSIPHIALAPLFLLFFGIGDWSKVAIAAFGVSFVMFYNVYFGMQTVRGELVGIVKVMGAKPWHTLVYVTLPSLMTPFISGLKASGPLAVIGVVVGEFLASFNGVGHQLYEDSNNLDAAAVFADIVVLVLIVLVVNTILGLLYRIVNRRLGMATR